MNTDMKHWPLGCFFFNTYPKVKKYRWKFCLSAFKYMMFRTITKVC